VASERSIHALLISDRIDADLHLMALISIDSATLFLLRLDPGTGDYV